MELTQEFVQSFARDLAALQPLIDAERREIADTVQTVKELLPTTTPGVKLLTISRSRTPEVTVRCDMKIDDLFGMRVKTPEAKATLAKLREDFDGIATFVVETK